MSEKLYHVDILNSKRDSSGNRYFVMIVTRNSDGKIVTSKVESSSNARDVTRIMTGGDWGYFTYSESEIGIREFNKLYKKAPYLGCYSEDHAKNILAEFDKQIKTEFYVNRMK